MNDGYKTGDPVNVAPINCPQCGGFGSIVLKAPEQDVCFQCGWTGKADYTPPKDFPRYVQVCGKSGMYPGQYCRLAPRHEGDCQFGESQ